MNIDINNIVPVGAVCLIKPYVSADVSESGLIMDNSSNTSSAPSVGLILEAGDTSRFKKGQILLFRRYAMDETKFITSEGEQVVNFVSDGDVIGIINSLN